MIDFKDLENQLQEVFGNPSTWPSILRDKRPFRPGQAPRHTEGGGGEQD